MWFSKFKNCYRSSSKVLTYMSNGLPVICSKKVSENFGNNVIIFKDNQELIKTIIDLKSNRSKSVLFSKKSIKFSKN